jgi:glycosyltransferase involved in cell wall biosynthesis
MRASHTGPPAASGAVCSRLRVLHVINNLGLGGAETLLYRLVIRDRSNEHVVVSLGPPEWYSGRLEESGIELHHLNMDSLAAVPAGMLRLNSILRQSGADVVQCWLYRSNLLGGMLSQAAGKPVAWGIHCSSLEPLKRSSRALVYLSGFLARWMPDFIVNCSARSQELHAKLGFSKARGGVVHNGYDPAAFYPDEAARLATRKALGIAPEQFAIGTVARWHPQKDIPNLLAAARLASDRGVPLTCLLIGSGLGPDNAELAKEVGNSRSEHFAVTLGERSDIQDIARALDLHVLASCGSEAFPNAVAETMLSGTPNAVTDIGDSALMVGKTGWVAPPRDPKRLADAIEAAYREWKEKPAQWKERRKGARKQIADNFTLDRMAGAYEAVWDELVAARRS